MLPGHGHAATATWSPSCSRELELAPRPPRRARATGADARAGAARGAAPPRGRVLVRAHGRRATSIGVRDPNGFRPLCLGKLDNGWVLASETPALDVVGAHFVRELEPGEMVVIDADGRAARVHPFPTERVDPTLCLFEFVYFARPDSRLYGQSVHQARVRMGEQLAEQAPVEADMVMGVPESGMPAAEGYARAQRHPLRPGPREEPLHRAHASSPRARRCGRSACA